MGVHRKLSLIFLLVVVFWAFLVVGGRAEILFISPNYAQIGLNCDNLGLKSLFFSQILSFSARWALNSLFSWPNGLFFSPIGQIISIFMFIFTFELGLLGVLFFKNTQFLGLFLRFPGYSCISCKFHGQLSWIYILKAHSGLIFSLFLIFLCKFCLFLWFLGYFCRLLCINFELYEL